VAKARIFIGLSGTAKAVPFHGPHGRGPGAGGLARPFFLILPTRVPCPCLSGFWRDGRRFCSATAEMPQPSQRTRKAGPRLQQMRNFGSQGAERRSFAAASDGTRCKPRAGGQNPRTMDPALEVKRKCKRGYGTTGSNTKQACPDAYLVTDACSIDPRSVLEAAGRRRKSGSAVAAVRENFAGHSAQSLSTQPNPYPQPQSKSISKWRTHK